MTFQDKRLTTIVLTAAFLLTIPLIAMQFTNDVDWKLSDFMIMGFLLLSTGLGCEFVLRKVAKTEHRIMLCAAILVVSLLIWIELAVGIFGSPFAGS